MILVIFDVDGTLVQSDKMDSKCFARTYEGEYGRTFPTIDWSQYPHVSDTTIFKTVIQNHFNRSVHEGEEESFRKKFVANIIQNRQTMPEAFSEVPFAKQTIDLLLSDQRYVVGVATGGWRDPAIVKLNFVGIPAERLLVSGADGKETREAIIQHTIEKARKQYRGINRIVYVGDAIWDVTTTRNMNLPFVGIRRRGDLDFFYERGVNIVLKNYEKYDLFLDGVSRAGVPLKIS